MLRRLPRSELLIIITLFFGAFVIRSVDIDWGLPSQQFPHSQFNQDETAELFGSLQLSEGVYQLGLLGYQPFFYYASFAYFMLYFVAGLMSGQFTSLADFQLQYGLDLPQFFVAGRLFMVAVGSVTVVLTYVVGRYMFGKRIGVASSLFLLISFGHTLYSKIFRLDSFLPLIFLLAFYLIIRLKEADQNKLRPYVLAGIAVAATAATKKTGYSMIVPFLLVPFVEKWVPLRWPIKLSGIDRRYPFGLTVMLASLVAFVGPYFVFLRAYRASAQEAVEGVLIDVGRRFGSSILPGNTYALSPFKWSLPWHLISTLPNELGLPIYILSLVGIGLMLFDRIKRRVVIYLLVTLAAFLVPIGFMARAPWRDMQPILPLLSICAGYGLVNSVAILTRRFSPDNRHRASTIVMTVLLLLVVVPPLVTLVRQQFLTQNADTRDIAKLWIEQNLPSGSQIIMEPFGPGILDADYANELIVAGEQSSQTESSPEYHIDMIVEGTGSVLKPDNVIPLLVETKTDYLVTSSAFYGRFYNGALDKHLPELSQDGRWMHDVIESNLELLVQFVPNWETRPGPVIKVYKVPDRLGAGAAYIPDSFEPYPEMDRPASAVGYYQFAPR